jgi:hypothetical protein
MRHAALMLLGLLLRSIVAKAAMHSRFPVHPLQQQALYTRLLLWSRLCCLVSADPGCVCMPAVCT